MSTLFMASNIFLNEEASREKNTKLEGSMIKGKKVEMMM